MGSRRSRAITLPSTLLGAGLWLASPSAYAATESLDVSADTEAPVAVAPAPAEAAEGAPADGAAGLTQEQVEAYLDSHALPKSPGLTGDSGAFAEVPPPPPRHRGLVIEASPGVFFPMGSMRHIAPPSPWLQFDVGYELANWFMLLAHADLTIADTSYAAEPPPPRTYAQYGFGVGGRFQYQFTDYFAAHVQVELGLTDVTEDVLAVYGFDEADELSMFFGGRLGIEWLQVNPHTALVLHGTIRDYPSLERINDSDAPLALIGALALRYAF